VNLPAWPILTDEEWQQIDHHVTTCDFPKPPPCGLVSAVRLASLLPAKCSATRFYRVYRYDH
jgi:hypothetical protein